MKYLVILVLIISILFGIVLANFNQKNYKHDTHKFLVKGKRNNAHSSVSLRVKKVSKNAHNYPKLRVTRKNERKKESVYDDKELKACSTKDKKNLKPVNAFMCMAEKLGRFISVFAGFPWCPVINGIQGVVNFFESKGFETCDEMCAKDCVCRLKLGKEICEYKHNIEAPSSSEEIK